MLTHVTSTNRNGTETEPVLILNTYNGEKQLQQEHIVSSCNRAFESLTSCFFVGYSDMENLPKKCHSGLGNYDGCLKTSGPWITIRWIQFDWTWQQSLILFSTGGIWIWYPQNVTMKWEVSNSWWHDPFLMRTARCISFAVSVTYCTIDMGVFSWWCSPIRVCIVI